MAGGMMGGSYGYSNMGMMNPMHSMGMGMGMGGMMMGHQPYFSTAPLNNITNMLFGLQQAIFSLSQVVQIVGMNSNALSQMVSSTLHLFDSAYNTISELHTLHQNTSRTENKAIISEDERK